MFFIDRVTFDGQLKMRNLHPRSSSRSPSSHGGSTRFIPLRGSAIQYNICDRRSRSNLWFGSYNSPRVSGEEYRRTITLYLAFPHAPVDVANRSSLDHPPSGIRQLVCYFSMHEVREISTWPMH